MIRVTFLAHSGFLLEWPDCYWLFDWWKGELPVLDPAKPLLVFASHHHEDHFQPHIFHIDHPDVRLFLASDIRLSDRNREKWQVPAELTACTIHRRQHYSFDMPEGTLELEALPSTDAGVGFLLTWQGKTIYHAGDLNWWDWPENTPAQNHNMAANFKKAVEPLEGMHIDMAFLPLDPHQKASYYLGMEWMLRHTRIDRVFPMHLWDEFDTIGRFRRQFPELSAPLIDVAGDGQSWEF